MDGIAEQNVIGVPNWQQASSSFTEKVILQNIRVRVPRREYAVFFVGEPCVSRHCCAYPVR